MEKLVKILVVEDEFPVKYAICYAIKKMAWEQEIEVLEAENGVEALNIIRTQLIDLVITDLVMPEMNGIGFIKSIRSEKTLKNLPILLLTGEAGDSLKEAEKAGIDGFIGKPFDINELEKKIKKFLK